jgi:hypothetical protein
MLTNSLEQYTSLRGDITAMESQPQEISNWASDLIISSVAQYPGSTGGDGPDTIIADRVMKRFESEAPSDRKIGMRQLTLIAPEPNYCATGINNTHERFGVPYRIGPARAALRVYRSALTALEIIRATTADVALESLTLLPAEIQNSLAVSDSNVFSGLYSINRASAICLEEYLSANPGIRGQVIASIRVRANEFRSYTREQQAFAAGAVAVLDQA